MPGDSYGFYIQGGKYKGKKLHIPVSSSTRSTKSIIRGSLFDTLQREIIDRIFIEVFAGSGSVGLEAISRGAKAAYFIERDKQTYEILQKNISLLSCDNACANLADSFEFYLPLADSLHNKKEKAFIYFDPPFDFRKGMEGIYEKVVDMIKKTPKDFALKIIIEHKSGIDFNDEIGHFKKIKTKKFGKTSLSYFMQER